jgi:hypothetical protein
MGNLVRPLYQISIMLYSIFEMTPTSVQGQCTGCNIRKDKTNGWKRGAKA